MELDKTLITIWCRDRHATVEFYSKILGAKLCPGYFDCPRMILGSLELSIVQNAEIEFGGTYPENSMMTLTLSVPDLESVKRHLVEQEVAIDSMTDFYIFIRDPDGIPIEIECVDWD